MVADADSENKYVYHTAPYNKICCINSSVDGKLLNGSWQSWNEFIITQRFAVLKVFCRYFQIIFVF